MRATSLQPKMHDVGGVPYNPAFCKLTGKYREARARQADFPTAACKTPRSAARGRAPPPLQAAAHRIRDVTPGGRARQRGWRAVLVDDVEEREPVCPRNPGVAHPDVEVALILLVGLLRELCALRGHPPCVVGLGSHDLPSIAGSPEARSYACICARLSDQRLSGNYFCA